MGKETKISWTESTLNTAMGCTKVSPECLNCYMYRSRFINPTKLTLTKAGQRKVLLENRIRSLNNLIFVNSMSDTFHKDIPDTLLDMWFSAFAEFPDKKFQILTKRPERAAQYLTTRTLPDNCWLGVSVGIKSSIPRIDILRPIHASIQFISFEPLLEDLGELNLQGIDWVIIGGESDFKNPRPMKPEWAENIIKQAKALGIPVWFKQIGGKGGGGTGGDILNGRQIHEMPKAKT